MAAKRDAIIDRIEQVAQPMEMTRVPEGATLPLSGVIFAASVAAGEGGAPGASRPAKPTLGDALREQRRRLCLPR